MPKGTTKRPVRRATRQPSNLSRAAGAPAPASAAATKPYFYNPDDEAVAEAPAQPQQRAAFEIREHAERLQEEASPLTDGLTGDRTIAEHAAAAAITDPNDLQSEIERIRKMRKPLGEYSQKLALPKRPGYHRHWFNDTAGRIEEAEANGWAHVRGTDNKPISRCVGTGRDKGALYAFAMEIPEVFWLEDMDARNRLAAEKMDSLKASPFRAAPGTAKAADRGKFYDPTEGERGPIQIEKV